MVTATNLTIDKIGSRRLYGLRGAAILLVLWSHCGFDQFAFPLGPVAVRLFFILSGFHITLSFWKAIQEAEPGTKPLALLKAFYVKRFLRIAPLYYGGLLIGAWMDLPSARHGLAWDGLFLTNVHVLKLGAWPVSTAHFWSLAVQEQFYLLWPVLLLLVGRRFFPALVAGSVALGLFFRFYCQSHDINPLYHWVMLPGCWDSFMAGAVVAYLHAYRTAPASALAQPTLARSRAKTLGAWARDGVWLALPFVLALAIYFSPPLSPIQFLCETLEAVSLGALIRRTLSDGGALSNFFLEHRALVHIGRTSYPLYIFQAFLYVLVWKRVVDYFGDNFTPLTAGISFVLVTALGILVVSAAQRGAAALHRRFQEAALAAF